MFFVASQNIQHVFNLIYNVYSVPGDNSPTLPVVASEHSAWNGPLGKVFYWQISKDSITTNVWPMLARRLRRRANIGHTLVDLWKSR